MTWFMAGAAAVTTVTSMYSANSAASASARAAGAQSRAEGEAVARERLNTTIRNSYNTALAQMNLGLKKKQLSQQATDIRAATLAAKGDATLAAAATGSIGASTNAVISDIEQKSQAALDQTTDAFENAIENYNMELQMMVINTDQTAPTVRPVEYHGPSRGEMIGAALMQGLGSFASNYAMRKMSLGLGEPATQVSSNAGMYGLDLNRSGMGLNLNRSGTGLRWPS